MARDAECLSEFVSRRKSGTASGAASDETPEAQRAGHDVTGEFG